MFHEMDRKGGYKSKNSPTASTRQAIRVGLKELKQEIKKWANEAKEIIEFDPITVMPLPGKYC